MKRRPNTMVNAMPPMASAPCPYPEPRPATSEPKPGIATLVVKQPQAVWRLSGRRGPSAKETFIGIHQRAHSKWQVEQEYEFKEERERDAEFGNVRHDLPQMAEVRRTGAHQVLHDGIHLVRDPDLDKDERQNHGQECHQHEAEGLEPN